MGFPTGGGSQTSLALALNDIMAEAATVKQIAIDARARMEAQSVDGSEIFALCQRLVAAKQFIDARASTSGLVDYAKQVFNNNNFNIATEYNALNTTLAAVVAGIDTRKPSELAGTTYNSGATTALRAALQNFIATID